MAKKHIQPAKGEIFLGTKPVQYPTPKIVLLNGAPKSGKDTMGALLTKKYRGRILKFAEPIKAGCAGVYCEGNRKIFNWYDMPERKDEAHEIFFGKTTREVQISMSEDWLKEFHSTAVFGNILATTLQRDLEIPTAKRKHQPIYFVTDSGFKDEAKVLIERFGAKNIKLIRLHKDGCSFKGDSRGYINLDPYGVKLIDIENMHGEQQRTLSLIDVALHNFI